jgi:hypothetical protein
MLDFASARADSEEFRSCWHPPETFQMQADSLGWGALWAAVGAFVTGLLAWLTQRSKGDSDRDVAVIAQWEKLTAALSARISDVESQLAQVRSAHAAEIDELRRTHRTEIDEMRKTHRVEMRAMRELNEGLQRMIAQDSQSTARLLGDTPISGSLHKAFDDESGEPGK